ncbi:FAD-binding oxidoreductase [Nocardioides pocheonensis]|uniref:FAD-binding oxidoreductase n=1 Tax=Nocardioides pocheonensis TaxID=661485 RepID=UPI001FE9EEBF|nr:FAD-binding oxidoreductase [Nocardioides pocheonensis]
MSAPADATVAPWTTARAAEVERIGDRLVRLRLELEESFTYTPGQHCVLRLRAEDGYTAQRSYSIASDPADPLLELMVECLPGGEVSGHLHDEARVGDAFELRGPIGGWFTWTGDVRAVCLTGGTGVVPVVSMLRYARRVGATDRLRVCAVGRTRPELPYADELLASGALVALTRENLGERVAAPPYPSEMEPLVAGVERAYVCGSVGFASYAVRLLGEVGVPADAIRVEQFGATG